MPTPIRDGGGVRDWLWKGAPKPLAASIDAVPDHPKGQTDLRYILGFTEVARRFEILNERVENVHPDSGHDKPCFYYQFENGHGVLNVKGPEKRFERRLQREDIEQPMTGTHREAAHDFPPDKGGSRGHGVNHAKDSNFATANPSCPPFVRGGTEA
jgi:hypothetical protein